MSSEREVLAELERRAARRRSSDKQVIKSASGTPSSGRRQRFGQFVTFINQQQSAMTGVGRSVADGRLRALA